MDRSRRVPAHDQTGCLNVGNPNILASFLVMTAAYSEGLFAPLKGGKRRASLAVIFLLAITCLILTFSRGNWIALFFVLFVFAGAFYHKAFLPFIGGGLGVLWIGWDRLSARIMSIFPSRIHRQSCV